MATNRQESSTDQPGPYTFCWGRAVHDDRFYLPRRGEEQLLSALRAGQFCTAFASPMCGLTSLGFRLGRRLKAEGVQVAYINSLYFGQAGHTEEMVYNTFADLVSQELDLPEEDLAQEDHPLRGHSYSCPVRVEFNAACRCKLGEPERLRCFLEAIAERGPLSIVLDDTVPTFDDGEALSFLLRTSQGVTFLALLRACCGPRLSVCHLHSACLPRPCPKVLLDVDCQIGLAHFTRDELVPLQSGLVGQKAPPEELLDEVFRITEGHPHYTQRLCDELVRTRASGQSPAERIAELSAQVVIQRKRVGAP